MASKIEDKNFQTKCKKQKSCGFKASRNLLQNRIKMSQLKLCAQMAEEILCKSVSDKCRGLKFPRRK